jgi:hypothetical protein
VVESQEVEQTLPALVGLNQEVMQLTTGSYVLGVVWNLVSINLSLLATLGRET